MIGPTTPIWALDPHTKAKHEILRRYLQAWFPILAKFSGRVIYLDGFAGPGIYKGGEEGSPIIAMRCLLEHSQKDKLLSKGREFIFVFIEKDSRRARILKEVLESRFPNLPNNVKYDVIGEEFAPTLESVLDELEEKGARLAPTFAFLDPFGFKGLPMKLIGRMLKYDRCEVLITFMSGFVRRFAELRENIMDELFGTDEWRKVEEVDAGKRKEFFLELYKRQLKEVGGAKYVISFEMIGGNNQVIYDLVFATKHWKGLEVMKEAMWKVDPRGTYRFSDTTDVGQKYLINFADKPHWIPNAAKTIYSKFKGKSVSVKEIHKFVITETPFIFRKSILKRLEETSKIVAVDGRRRKFTYPDDSIITFL